MSKSLAEKQLKEMIELNQKNFFNEVVKEFEDLLGQALSEFKSRKDDIDQKCEELVMLILESKLDARQAAVSMVQGSQLAALDFGRYFFTESLEFYVEKVATGEVRKLYTELLDEEIQQRDNEEEHDRDIN